MTGCRDGWLTVQTYGPVGHRTGAGWASISIGIEGGDELGGLQWTGSSG